jgi:hypothetical protein
MPLDEGKAGRRSTDVDLAVVVERLDTQDETLGDILRQTRQTNGRVSELEVKERIRQDREEQRAIRLAASEAAKWRVEQQEEQERTRTEERVLVRGTRKVMLFAAGVGAVPAVLFEVVRLVVLGHL